MKELEEQFINKLIESLKAETGWEYFVNNTVMSYDTGIMKEKSNNRILLIRMIDLKDCLRVTCYAGGDEIDIPRIKIREVLDLAMPLEEKLRSKHVDAKETKILNKAISIL